MQRFDPTGAGRQSSIAAIGPAEAPIPSPGSDATVEWQEAPCSGTPDALLGCLQGWPPRLRRAQAQPALAGEPGLHYRIRCAAPSGATDATGATEARSDGRRTDGHALFDAAALADGLARLTPPLPPQWRDALLLGWPDGVRGLHRIELVPGRAWVSIEIGLRRDSLRRLDARRVSPRPSPPGDPDVLIVGAGLAGCALSDAFARRGWRVRIVEGSDRIGGAVAGIPLLAQHPALSPGGDRRSRLLIAALLASRRLAPRLGSALIRCGRFQPMPLAEARLRAAEMPVSLAQVVACSSRQRHGVDGLSGIWFPDCAMADPQAWWRRVLQAPGVELSKGRTVAAIERHAGRWQALSPGGDVIASAAVMVLANQAGALELAALPPVAAGRLRLNRIQVAIGSVAVDATPGVHAAPAADADPRQPSILGGSSYRLENPGHCCVIGPLHPGVDSLADHRIGLPPPNIGDPPYRWRISEPAERLQMRDNLPMIGAAPDTGAIDAERRRYERNDRLPLPRREALHLLTGLGGRGLLWSVIGAEIIAAQANGEPPVVEPELEDAVDPARFLRRDLRRANSQADGTNVLSS